MHSSPAFRGRKAVVRSVISAAALAAVLSLPAARALPSSASTEIGAELCGPKLGSTLIQDREIRLYSLRSEVKYGCLRASGVSRSLGPIRSGDGVWRASMPGPFAVNAPSVGGIEARVVGQDTVRLFTAARNVRSGKATHCLLGGADRPGQLPLVRRVMLDPEGSVIWVAIMRLGVAGPAIGVCESAGSPRILGMGSGIDVASVSLQGSTLTWLDAGVRQSRVVR
jgi:hypothetical protein